LNTLVWRSLGQNRLRTTLSSAAVALGVGVTVAADVVNRTLLGLEQEGFVAFAAEILGFALTAVGIVILAAAGFLVFNAFAMTIAQRYREIGALRALGMVRRQVMRMVLTEALITGGLGTLLGMIGGPLVGRAVLSLIRAITGDFLKGTLDFQAASFESFVLAAALGLGVTLLSVLVPAWQATRIAPLEALRSEGQFQHADGISETGFRKRGRWGGSIIVLLFVLLVIAPPAEWALPPWDLLLAGLFTSVWLGALALTLPGLIGGVGHWARRSLERGWGATARLIVDNLGRARRRVTLTIVTISIGLAMIVAVTGIITYTVDVVMTASWGQGFLTTWVLSPFDFSVREAPVGPNMEIPSGLFAALGEQMGERAEIAAVYSVDGIRETSLLPGLGTGVIETQHLRRVGEVAFTFYEGDWETAWPHLDSVCGLLLSPLVARRNDVWLGDAMTIHGLNGPVDCTVAGIVSSVFFGTSIIGTTDPDLFGVENPSLAFVRALPGVDGAGLKQDLATLADRYPGVWLFNGGQVLRETLAHFDNLKNTLSGLLLLAILTAALGVINTTVMSVVERRRELGLLRAVGATRRQVQAVVMGEAALMGLIGAGLGLVAGAGVTVILALVAGGSSFGVQLPLWPSAWTAVRPALLNGLIGLIAAPLISAGAAWLPTRPLLRAAAVETLRES
jgi:putative ABC transport system permease protein